MSHALLRSLFDHVSWANARVIAAYREAPGIDTQARAFLAHILAAEHIWLARVQGRAPSHRVWPALTIEECEALAADNARGYAELLAQESDASLERVVTYTTTDGTPYATRLADILSHVALHGAYHRGQVALLVRRGDGTPAPTDFIVYARDAASGRLDVPPPSVA